MTDHGRVGSAETGSRASTEPLSGVSAASGFDPARKSNGFTEDASKPAPKMAALLRALAGDPDENYRQMQEQCIRAIERGDTYGWPPMLVAECEKIIAERIPLTECVGDPLLKRKAA